MSSYIKGCSTFKSTKSCCEIRSRKHDQLLRPSLLTGMFHKSMPARFTASCLTSSLFCSLSRLHTKKKIYFLCPKFMTMPIPSALWSAHHKTHQYRLNLVRDYRHWAETKQRLLQRWGEIKLGVLGKKLSLRHGGSEIHYFLWVTSQRSLSTRNIQAAVAENIIKWGASLPVVAQSMEDKWETRWLACLLAHTLEP
jgi:hypothetical protein